MAYLHKLSDGKNDYFTITDEAKSPVSGKASVSLKWLGRAKSGYAPAIKQLGDVKDFSKEEVKKEEVGEKIPDKTSSVSDYLRDMASKLDKD